MITVSRLAQADHPMLARGDAHQCRQRLALRTRAENRELVVGNAFVLLRSDEHPGRDVQISELLGDLDVLEHRAADDEAAPSARLRGVDRLLQARDVGREGRHQDAPLRRGEDGREPLADGALARGRPLLLRVGAVAHEQEHTFVADASESCQVGRLALHRRAVDLEVARVHDDARGRAHHERARVGDRVSCVHPFDFEAAQRARIAGRTVCSSVVSMSPCSRSLLRRNPSVSAVPYTGTGRRGSTYGQRADVVLVAVGQHDAADVADALLQPCDVRDHQVDAEHLLLREHQARCR